MKVVQSQYSSAQEPDFSALAGANPQLILVFGSVEFFAQPAFSSALALAFPKAQVLGCSTAGEITNQGVSDHTAVVSAIHFDHPSFRTTSTPLSDMDDSAAAGKRLAAQLKAEGLHAVLVFGLGVNINGSELIHGMAEILGDQVVITGGLAGDNGAFSQTWTLGKEGPSSSTIVAAGFYGSHQHLSHGSFGGWQAFGPARKVTRSKGNMLYELDGEPALEVYKRYLGDHARDLPASGLLFPFAMLGADHNETGLIRTILGINEAEGSLTLAGDIEEGGFLRLMHASTDALVDGAETAAKKTRDMHPEDRAGLAILVSCVGRKLVMGGRVDEEVEAVSEVLGKDTVLAGFYSYGEINPFLGITDCKLHNQTMTISFLTERI
jgi:hypothetical protein